MSLPEVEQDGMIATESFVNAMACDKMESRLLQWGENNVLVKQLQTLSSDRGTNSG